MKQFLHPKPTHGGRLALLAGLFVLLLGVVSYAQTPVDEPGSAGDQSAPVQPVAEVDASADAAMPTIRQMFEFSPIINSVILGLSAISMMLFIYLLLTIHARAMVPQDFVDEVTKLVVRGKYEVAADLCRANRRIFVATIIQRCLENANKPTSVIQNIIDTEGRRRADVIWNRISYLSDIANVAPMLGLLGTVIGMIRAFFTLDKTSGNIAVGSLSNGVGQAMTTTMVGIAVAIVTLLFYSIMKSRTTQTLAEAEAAVHSITDHIEREAPKLRKRVAVKPAGPDGNDRPPLRPVAAGRRPNPLEVRVNEAKAADDGPRYEGEDL